jgi:hypothetical protein
VPKTRWQGRPCATQKKEHFETKTPSPKFLKNSLAKKGCQKIPAALNLA